MEENDKRRPGVIEQTKSRPAPQFRIEKPYLTGTRPAQKQPVLQTASDTDTHELPINTMASAVGEKINEQSRVQQAEETAKQKSERYNQAIENGTPARIALIESYKPAPWDEKQEKKMRTAAKILAIGDMLAALSSGIIGMSTQGYVPKTGGGKSALPLLDKLKESQDRYHDADREYEKLRLNVLLNGENDNIRRAENEYKNAEAILRDERKYEHSREMADAQNKNRQAAQKEKNEYDLTALDLRHQNNMKEIGARGSQQRSTLQFKVNTGGGSGSKKPISFKSGRKTVTLSDAEANHYYDLGVKYGLIPEEGAKQTFETNTKSSSSDKWAGDKTSTSIREVAYSFNKQSPQEQVRMLRNAYEVDRLIEAGFSGEELRKAKELIVEDDISAEDIISYFNE